MPDTTTRPGADRRPLISYLKVQKQTDQEVLAILRATARSIEQDLARLSSSSGIGAAVRADQLRLAQVEVNRKLAQAWDAVGDSVQSGRAAAAAAAAETSLPSTWLKAVLPDADVDYMMASARAQAARGIDTLQARLELSQIPLSESVYNNKALSKGTIDSIVNSGLAAGASAAEIAAKVRSYINPNTPGGVKYASMRLGRTELNNAFHAQQVQEGIKTPWTLGLKWNLSGSHPRPDECNEYADGVHMPNGEAGVYEPGDVPPKPHPNCLCYTTPVTDDREEFIRKLKAGEYDDYLDEEFGLDASSRFSAAPPAPRVPTATTPKPKPSAQAAVSHEPLKTDFHAAMTGDKDAIKAMSDDFLTTSNRALDGTGYKVVEYGTNRLVGGRDLRFRYAVQTDAGEHVGVVYREMTRLPDGSLSVENEKFVLYPDHQGQGIATRLAPALEDWYRANGVSQITVHANIDVGGYTWAKQGFGWNTDLAVVTKGFVQDHIRVLSKYTKDHETLDGWISKMTDDPSSWPTPYDIAMFGYTNGATTWPGKKAMLDSNWRGRKRL